MSGYVLSIDADFDLDDILGVHRSGSRRRCCALIRKCWIGKLFDAFEALGLAPGMGHRREDLTSYRVLYWAVSAYFVIYRAERRPIEIVAVTQGSRDIPAFLRRRICQ